MKKNKITISEELFQLYFELRLLHPKIEDWNETFFEKRPPLYYRFQKVSSILKSFDCTIDSFIAGDFIQSQKEVANSKFHLLLKAKFPKICRKSATFEKLEVSELVFLFTKLMSYREKISELFDINSDVLVASYNFSLPIELINNLNHKIANKTKIIDRLLIMFLETKLTNMDRKTLTLNFNYPNVDIMEIDIDFM